MSHDILYDQFWKEVEQTLQRAVFLDDDVFEALQLYTKGRGYPISLLVNDVLRERHKSLITEIRAQKEKDQKAREEERTLIEKVLKIIDFADKEDSRKTDP